MPRAAAAMSARLNPSRWCHVITGLIPDRQKYALAFVVTCPVGMRLTEVTKSDRAIDG